MFRQFLLYLALFLMVFTVGCAKKTTEGATADGVDWAARAKQYRDNPDALRQLVEDCENTEAQLLTARQELNRYQSQSGNEQQALSAAQAQAAQAQQEIAQLRQQLAAAQAAPRNDQVDTDRAVVQGVIFQVQLGAFAQNRVDPNLATDDALELQEQNGMQKFVVSQFRTYANAVQLRDRLRQMGVRDAFIVAKNNGQRIDVPAALRLTGQG